MAKYLPLLFMPACILAALPVFAQEPAATDTDGSSVQVEESDEAYRRRMELEDARRRDPGYTPPVGGPEKAKEKIDELPAESQANIRDQLVDIIMENGEWEPSDALKDYPYQPTEAAGEDSGLLQQEQEAWAEQVEKYHQREAEAFGAHRGPPPGPGAQQGADGQGENGGEDGDGGQAGAGGQGGESGRSGSAGTYSPYTANRSDSEEEVSTAGAQQSALDFLRGGTGAAQPAANEAAADGAAASAAAAAASDMAAESAESSESSEAAESSDAADPVTERDIPGIIAIEDLDKLEGGAPPGERDPEEPPRP